MNATASSTKSKKKNKKKKASSAKGDVNGEPTTSNGAGTAPDIDNEDGEEDAEPETVWLSFDCSVLDY